MNRFARAPFAVVLLVDLLAAAAILALAGRPWQTVVAPRSAPLSADVLDLTGRKLDPGITALALVALVGAIAVLATKRHVRRLVGLLVAVVGGALVWQAATGFSAVSQHRAHTLLTDGRSPIGIDPTLPVAIATHPIWPALTLLCGLLVVLAGLAVAAFGHRWVSLSNRYEAPTAAAKAARAPTEANLWSALDRGDDPTTRTES